mmetsp:Transcript_66583/g.164135  ORF Transcript_66583/g.164135 Transcript_66583/m.164135 type:complete len:258 (-) Transcript_66583:435-1208(-)
MPDRTSSSTSLETTPERPTSKYRNELSSSWLWAVPSSNLRLILALRSATVASMLALRSFPPVRGRSGSCASEAEVLGRERAGRCEEVCGRATGTLRKRSGIGRIEAKTARYCSFSSTLAVLSHSLSLASWLEGTHCSDILMRSSSVSGFLRPLRSLFCWLRSWITCRLFSIWLLPLRSGVDVRSNSCTHACSIVLDITVRPLFVSISCCRQCRSSSNLSRGLNGWYIVRFATLWPSPARALLASSPDTNSSFLRWYP